MKARKNKVSKEVTIIGDTSKFHLGSKINYGGFRKLVNANYNILQEIPYDAFGIDLMDFQTFMGKLKKLHWWEDIKNSDILIVHGEGLTEKHDNYVYPYLYFSQISKELGSESWLVNFAMYEGEPFIDLLNQFSYMACRDILTHEHLLKLGFNPELSFDCSILGANIEGYTDHNDHIAAIRGRNTIDDRLLEEFDNIVKYNCCWQWKGDAMSLQSIKEYTSKIKRAKFVLSTSFHANIIAYLSGVPFIPLDFSNPKYLSLSTELLPFNITIKDYQELNNRDRKLIHNHYQEIFDDLVKRAKLNVI